MMAVLHGALAVVGAAVAAVFMFVVFVFARAPHPAPHTLGFAVLLIPFVFILVTSNGLPTVLYKAAGSLFAVVALSIALDWTAYYKGWLQYGR